MPLKDPEKRKAYDRAYRKSWYESEANREKKRAYNKAWLEANREKRLDYFKTWRANLSQADKEKRLAYHKTYNKTWYKANEAKAKANNKTWYENNKEKRQLSVKAYRETHKEEQCANQAKRKALKKQAILPTTDDELIKNLYKQRGFMAEENGEQYHVDHIIPLSIGGAHHQDNLRIITATENLEKHNKYIPELGGVWADNKLARKNRKKYEAL